MTDIAATLQRAVAALWRPRHASYRLQLGRSLTLDQVAAVGPSHRSTTVNHVQA